MNVQELKAALDEYADHLPVVISVFDVEYDTFDLTSGDHVDTGEIAVVIEVEA